MFLSRFRSHILSSALVQSNNNHYINNTIEISVSPPLCSLHFHLSLSLSLAVKETTSHIIFVFAARRTQMFGREWRKTNDKNWNKTENNFIAAARSRRSRRKNKKWNKSRMCNVQWECVVVVDVGRRAHLKHHSGHLLLNSERKFHWLVRFVIITRVCLQISLVVTDPLVSFTIFDLCNNRNSNDPKWFPCHSSPNTERHIAYTQNMRADRTWKWVIRSRNWQWNGMNKRKHQKYFVCVCVSAYVDLRCHVVRRTFKWFTMP